MTAVSIVKRNLGIGLVDQNSGLRTARDDTLCGARRSDASEQGVVGAGGLDTPGSPNNLRMAKRNLDERLCRPGRFTSPLLPLLQRTWRIMDYLGKLSLREASFATRLPIRKCRKALRANVPPTSNRPSLHE